NQSGSSSRDTSTPRKESHTPSMEVPSQTPPPSLNKEHESSTPSSSTQLYEKKIKEVKQETIEEEPLSGHSELPSGLENVIVLSESDDGEVPNPTGTSEVTIEKEKEVSSTEPPSTTDSSTQEAPDASLTSLLEATVVNTLSAMSSLSLGPLVPSSSSSTFSWVQPLVDSRKRKPSSHLTGPNFDVVAAFLGTTPPP
ncbi:hypothetical protein KI387_025196, partial [Taxus chinensis]